MRWTRRLYPVLFAIFPVLGIAARNPGYYGVDETIALSAVAIVVAAAVYAVAYGLSRLRLRHDHAADVAALATVAVVALVYAYGSLDDAWQYVVNNPRMGTALVLAVVGVLAGAVLVAYRLGLHRRVPRLSDIGAFLSLVGALLVGGAIAQLVYYRISGALAVRRSALVRELARPVPVRRVASLHGSGAGAALEPRARDIYVIVLDEYPAADVLRELFGFDNRPFEDSLRAIGFRVPASVRSNYAHTLLSVSSLLNFSHMRSLADVMSPGSIDFGPAAYLLEHNRAERFLKRRGYRFVFFPSSWYGPTRSNSDADEQFDPDSTFDVGRALQRSELATDLASATPVRALFPDLATEQEVHTRDAAAAFAALAGIPRDPRPTFTIAHLLMPHVPYIEDAECRPLPRGTQLLRDTSSASRAALAAEMQCLNRQILVTVRALIARSNPKPIIVLQGDHGTQSLGIFLHGRALPTPEQARERFRAFGAYYLPDGGGQVIPDSISIVNVMRYVFSYYFDADLPPLPNTMYYSHWHYPYRITELDDDFHVIVPGSTRNTRAASACASTR